MPIETYMIITFTNNSFEWISYPTVIILHSNCTGYIWKFSKELKRDLTTQDIEKILQNLNANHGFEFTLADEYEQHGYKYVITFSEEMYFKIRLMMNSDNILEVDINENF